MKKLSFFVLLALFSFTSFGISEDSQSIKTRIKQGEISLKRQLEKYKLPAFQIKIKQEVFFIYY